MLLLFYIITTISLLGIAFQDFKERRVSLILFISYLISGILIFYLKCNSLYFFVFTLLSNLIIILSILFTILIFSKYIIKKAFFSLIGLGDILFFIAFSFSFPTFTFLNFFIFSIIFTFAIHFLFKLITPSKLSTIPLAGGMAIFVMCVYFLYWTGINTTIFIT